MNIPVTSIHGIGPVKAEILKTEAGIETVEDLLYYIPRKYLDRSLIKPMVDCFSNEEVTVGGKIISVNLIRRRQILLQVDVSDGTDIVSAVFFGAAGFLQKLFNEGDFILLSGRINILRGKQIVHPDFDFIDESSDIKSVNTGRIIPLYRSTNSLKKNGFDSRGFRRLVKSVLEHYISRIEETIPESILNKYGLIRISDALKGIHFPDTIEHAEQSRMRLAFNEIYFFQYYILLLKKINNAVLPYSRTISAKAAEKFIKTLKFSLTNDQLRAVDEISADLNSPYPMNRLLQGDVGSGKTVVALAGAVITISRGRQAALMVPTEILAQQHYETSLKILPENIRTILITGSMTQKERKTAYEMISSGNADLVIGTHALIQSAVNFKQLGYIIIDEQHRFGVEQRGKLRTKGETPDLLVMTATPIPRSLSMTLYGDLDVSYIREKPADRLPVKTLAFPVSRLGGVYNSMRNYLKQGRQIFYVLPIIEESEKIDLKSAVETYNHLKDTVFTDMSVALLHGKIPQNEKDDIMLRFRKGEINILVSTTVIEVGIDIPNANVMVIEHSERFGLAQLHQLRGRVGRGEHQSFCILIHPEKISGDAEERIKILTESDDGFIISEKDLQLRGSGQLIGTRQHGFTDFEFADLGTDIDIIINARREAEIAISELQDMEEELNNIRHNRFNKQLKGLRHKRILSLLS
ncbi:MAG: DNA helicase RecG [Spirochaetae bacterium HGW-Spirochaetae-5]|nr:MAG: DNA helicase RecG [Spirochaetae bacterium HGW-Spirochaetae-5]